MRTRFAPSPTGPLHLGHAYSAMLAHDMAKAANGTFLVRIEDIDQARCRPKWETLIFEDLRWLGLCWPTPVLRQSDHLPRYEAALNSLADRGLVYPCRCSRSDIQVALSAPQEGSQTSGTPYPGTCRNRSMADRMPDDALRLNLQKALDFAGIPGFSERGKFYCGDYALDVECLLTKYGDAVLGRRDSGNISYVLASVLDDAHENISDVVRGEDLFEITHLQVLLQALLGLPTPVYHHHALIRDENGKRLAKRDNARAISKYRMDGATPADVRKLIGLF